MSEPMVPLSNVHRAMTLALLAGVVFGATVASFVWMMVT
jgi:hypothetical protein